LILPENVKIQDLRALQACSLKHTVMRGSICKIEPAGYTMNEGNLLKRIVIDPKIMLGKPVIKGTRLTVELIVEKIAFAATTESLKKDYPFLTSDDIKASLLYAAKRLDHEEVFAA